jgi:hypothetical protein
MAFFTYPQNNSGGVYQPGQPRYVIIEAPTAEAANERAETQEVGLYFGGVSDGRDCGCCGDRWTPAHPLDATDRPEIYGKPASDSLETQKVYPL